MIAAYLFLSITYVVTVAGLGGEPDYEQRFAQQAAQIETLLKREDTVVKTLSGPAATRQAVGAALAQVAAQAQPDDSFALILIGHGTFDGTEYKFNLPGPDFTASEMAVAIDKIRAGRQLVVNTTSASGASLHSFQHPKRAVIAATKSGTEKNAPVFARYFVEALRDPAADFDKNEVVTALEAYRYADQKTAAYYETQKRLATEHPMLEDTGLGDGVRTPSPDNGRGQAASRFALVKLGAAQIAAATPEKKALLAKKEQLETSIDKLKYQKAAMPQEEYKRTMQALLLELARLQEEIDK